MIGTGNSAAISARGTQTKLYSLERTLSLLFNSEEISCEQHRINKEKYEKILAFLAVLYYIT